MEYFDYFVAFITELFAIMQSIVLYAFGEVASFSYFGLNPSSLSEEQASKPAILFLHGFLHNQSAILPLAHRFKGLKVGPLFTLNFDYDDKNPDKHQNELVMKISQIQEKYKEHGKDLHLILIGHSKGAIEAAYYVYCQLLNHPKKGLKIDKIITIAGRLKLVPTKWRTCPFLIKNKLKEVHEAIQDHPEIPLFAIVSDKDWKIPTDSGIIQADKNHLHIVKNRSHLGILYGSETHEKVLEIIKK